MSGKDGYIPSMAAELAGLAVKSVRRIVVKFPEAFSPGARRGPGKRGNRFTVQDVDNLKVLKGREKESLWYFVNYPILVNRVPAGQAEEASVETFTGEVRKLRSEVKELRGEVAILTELVNNHLRYHQDRQAEIIRIDEGIHQQDLRLDAIDKLASKRAGILLERFDELEKKVKQIAPHHWWNL